VNREVVSEVSPLTVTGQPAVKKIFDPALYKGERYVEDAGEPSRSVSVRRIVYDENGEVLYDATWYSSYRSEPRIVHIGTKPRPVEEEPKPPKDPSEPEGGSPGGSGAGAGAGVGEEPPPGEEAPPPAEEEPPPSGDGSAEPPPPPA
jgi:hypothetical protein